MSVAIHRLYNQCMYMYCSLRVTREYVAIMSKWLCVSRHDSILYLSVHLMVTLSLGPKLLSLATRKHAFSVKCNCFI